MPIDRFVVKAHWVESYHSKVITESVEPFFWWVDPSNPAAQSMYGILWQAFVAGLLYRSWTGLGQILDRSQEREENHLKMGPDRA